jgi:hypothetical protein
VEASNVEDIFKSVQRSLEAKTWFARGKWISSCHPLPKVKPEGITFHVYKKHWFNEDKLGIHFESYLYFDLKKRKKSYVTLHVLHHDRIPHSGKKRAEISKPFVDSIIDEVSQWEGFRFRAGKYGLQPFTKNLEGSDADFRDQLEREITRLCQKLGPVMDQVIERFVL